MPRFTHATPYCCTGTSVYTGSSVIMAKARIHPSARSAETPRTQPVNGAQAGRGNGHWRAHSSPPSYPRKRVPIGRRAPCALFFAPPPLSCPLLMPFARSSSCHSERSALARSRRIPQVNGHSELASPSTLSMGRPFGFLGCARNDRHTQGGCRPDGYPLSRV